MEWMIYVVTGICFSAVIGYLIGNTREDGGGGAVLGGLFGPLGWLMILCSEDDRRKCPLCQGRLPRGPVVRCKHCGGELKSAPPSPLTAADPVEQWAQREALKPGNLKPLVKKDPALRPPPPRDRRK